MGEGATHVIHCPHNNNVRAPHQRVFCETSALPNDGGHSMIQQKMTLWPEVAIITPHDGGAAGPNETTH